MESIGIDVHKVNSQICIVGENAEVLEERSGTEDPNRSRAIYSGAGEAAEGASADRGVDGERMGREVPGGTGHEVIVADPNFAPMYATRSKRVKTDRRDARTLAQACRLGAYRRAHRTSEEQRRVRASSPCGKGWCGRERGNIPLVRSLLRREGIRMRSGAASSFSARVGELSLAQWLAAEMARLW